MALFSLISPGIEGSSIGKNFEPKLFFFTDIIFLDSKSFEILEASSMSGSGPCVLESSGTTLTSINSGSLDFVVRMNL
jgi:hypothetical protein